MANQIKIDADFKGVIKGFNDLKKQVQSLGKEKFGINLDERTLKNFERNTQKTYDSLIERNKKLSEGVNKLSKKLEETFDPKKAAQYEKLLDRILTKINKNTRAASQMQSGMGGGGAPAPGAAGRFALPGMKGGLLKGGAIGIAANLILGSVMSLFEPARQAAESRMSLRGMRLSNSQLLGLETGGLKYGFNAQQSREQAFQLMRATGGVGSLGQVQSLSRGTGISAGDLISGMGNLRNAGIRDNQSIRLLKDIFTDAVAAGFDQSRALEVMNAVTQQANQMAAVGGVNVDAIRDTVIGLMSSSDFFAQNAGRAQNVGRRISGMFEQTGPMQGVAMRGLLGMARSRGMNLSPTQLLYSTRQGLFKDDPAGFTGSEKLQSFVGQTLSEMMGTNIKAGRGAQGVTGDVRLRAATGMSMQTGLDQDTIQALISSYLSGGDKDRTSFFKSKVEEQAKLQRTTNEILNSTDQSVLQMAASVDVIKEKVSLLVSTLLPNQNMSTTESFVDNIMKSTGIGYPIYRGVKSLFSGDDSNVDATTSNFIPNKNTNIPSQLKQRIQLGNKIFKSYGADDIQSAGILDALLSENSSLDPGLNELNPLVPGSRGGGGIAQWTGKRRRLAEKNVENFNQNLEGQFKYIFEEDNSHSQMKKFMSKKYESIQEASQAFQQIFERPGIPYRAGKNIGKVKSALEDDMQNKSWNDFDRVKPVIESPITDMNELYLNKDQSY